MTAGSLRLGVVSDLHYTPHPSPDLSYHGPFDVPAVLHRLADALDWFASEHADLLVVAGDLAQDGDPGSLLTVLRAVAEGWTGPVLAVPGNHDQLLGENELVHAVRKLADPRVDAPSFEGRSFGGVRLASLNGVTRGGPPATWGEDCVVLVSHFPVLSRAEAFAERGLLYAGDLPGIRQLTETLIARAAPTVVVNGHLHARDTHREGNVLQLTVAPLVEAPFEATLIDIVARATHVTVNRHVRGLGPGAGAATELVRLGR